MNNTNIMNLFFYGVLLFGVAACSNQQGMMQGNGAMHGNGAFGMADWNWLLIVIVLGVGLVLGLLLAQKRGSRRRNL